jgi:hypothetical protein
MSRTKSELQPNHLRPSSKGEVDTANISVEVSDRPSMTTTGQRISWKSKQILVGGWQFAHQLFFPSKTEFMPWTFPRIVKMSIFFFSRLRQNRDTQYEDRCPDPERWKTLQARDFGKWSVLKSWGGVDKFTNSVILSLFLASLLSLSLHLWSARINKICSRGGHWDAAELPCSPVNRREPYSGHCSTGDPPTCWIGQISPTAQSTNHESWQGLLKSISRRCCRTPINWREQGQSIKTPSSDAKHREEKADFLFIEAVSVNQTKIFLNQSIPFIWKARWSALLSFFLMFIFVYCATTDRDRISVKKLRIWKWPFNPRLFPVFFFFFFF